MESRSECSDFEESEQTVSARRTTALAEATVDGFVNEAYETEDDDDDDDDDDDNNENGNDVRRRLDFGPLPNRSPRFVRRNACRRIRCRQSTTSRRKFEFRATPMSADRVGGVVAPPGDVSLNICSRDLRSTVSEPVDVVDDARHFCSDSAVDQVSCPIVARSDSSPFATAEIACVSSPDRYDDLSGIVRNSDRSVISRITGEDAAGLCSRCASLSPLKDNPSSLLDAEQELAVAAAAAVIEEGHICAYAVREWDAIPARGVANRDQLSGSEQSMHDDSADMTNLNVHANGGGGGGSANANGGGGSANGNGGSGGPPNLLPRRHGGGQQPPPLPPARHRGNTGVAPAGAGGNCCCCGSSPAQLPATAAPDRRAVATVSEQYPTSGDFRSGHRIGHRRERRQKQGTSADMSSPPNNSSSASSPPGLQSPSPPPPIPPHGPEVNYQPTGNNNNNNNSDVLPDILNSHLPPPYSTLPHTTEQSSSRGLNAAAVPQHPPPPPPPPPPRSPPSIVVTTAGAAAATVVSGPGSPPVSPPRRSTRAVERFSSRHRSNRPHRSTQRGTHYTPEDEPKNCCGVAVTQTVSIRWFIVMIAFVGLCCAVVGTVLGALKATGREHLTVSLLMIGVGIVLITVSGIAWRLTSHDAPSCRMMLGLHSEEPEPNRRFVPRVPPSYGRPHHPYAAMMYPEFQYRPPPPSYQASMQEYRLRLLLLDRHQPAPSTSHSPVSPPPTYRSNAGTNNDTFTRPPITFARESDHYSRPPSYRSRASSVNPNPGTTRDTVCHPSGGGPNTVASGYVVGTNGTMERTTATSSTSTACAIHHSRDPSLSLSLLSHESLFDMAAPSMRGNGNANSNTTDRTNNIIVSNKVRTPPDVTTGRCPIVTNVSTNSTSALRSLEPAIDSRQHLRTIRGNVDNNRFSVNLDVDSGGGDQYRRDCCNVDVETSAVIANATMRTAIKRPHDCNVVTIVQTNNSSRVLAHDGDEQGLSTSNVGVQVHRTSPTSPPPQPPAPPGELEVLAHL